MCIFALHLCFDLTSENAPEHKISVQRTFRELGKIVESENAMQKCAMKSHM